MLVRIESIHGTDHILVIDEIDRLLGEMYRLHFYKLSGEPQEIDEYIYYTVNKEQIQKYLK